MPMDEIGQLELLAWLNELLEAERAGARVALATRKQADRPYLDLMRDVHVDESRWCAMLVRHIERIGGVASPRCGAFYDKAMAVSDLRERVTFLNRGQGWVVRRLQTLMERVSDDALLSDLHAMLDSHRINIDRADALLARQQ